MATASHPVAAPAAADRGTRRARTGVAAAVTVVGVAVLVKVVFGPWYLNYDARYALLWARDVSRGHTPDFDAAYAPTPHPLSTAWSALALPFGDGGDRLMVWLVLLSLGALVYLAYRLGADLFSPAVGVVTAGLVLTRALLLRAAVPRCQDLPLAALVVAAVLAEVRRRRPGGAGGRRLGPGLVLALLALAGLLRPEAWVLAGLYWLSLAPTIGWQERAKLGALVLVAPVAWVLMDLVATGDPLHS